MGYQFGPRLSGSARALSGLPRKNCAAATAVNNAGDTLALLSQTITASGPWTAPARTASLVTLRGAGGTGSPGGDWMGTYTHYTITRYYDGSGVEYGTPAVEFYPSSPGHAPANYCDPAEPYVAIGEPADATKQVCHYFYDDTTDAVVGGTTTAFGFSFTGGNGGPALPVQYDNVAITPGATYDLNIAAGGSATFTYYG